MFSSSKSVAAAAAIGGGHGNDGDELVGVGQRDGVPVVVAVAGSSTTVVGRDIGGGNGKTGPRENSVPGRSVSDTL